MLKLPWNRQRRADYVDHLTKTRTTLKTTTGDNGAAHWNEALRYDSLTTAMTQAGADADTVNKVAELADLYRRLYSVTNDVICHINTEIRRNTD